MNAFAIRFVLRKAGERERLNREMNDDVANQFSRKNFVSGKIFG